MAPAARQYGQWVNFVITPGNVSDNNAGLLIELLRGLKGQCFGDRGYLTKLFAEFYQQGLHIVTKVRPGMKNVLMPPQCHEHRPGGDDRLLLL